MATEHFLCMHPQCALPYGHRGPHAGDMPIDSPLQHCSASSKGACCGYKPGHAGAHGFGVPWLVTPLKVVPDPVNHPTHYTSDPSGVECIQITRHRNFNIGNAIKYLWRAGLKGTDSTIQDLEKAIFYINDEIERLRNVEG